MVPMKTTSNFAGSVVLVFGSQVVGTWRFGPVLALVVDPRWLAFELAAHGAFEHVGVHERVAMAVGTARASGGKVTIAEVKVLSGTFGSACSKRGARVSDGCAGAGGVGPGFRPQELQPATTAATAVIRRTLAMAVRIMDVSLSWSVATWMIVLPGMRRRGANASAVSARGRTAPTMRLQPPVPHSLGQVREPGAVGLDHEEDGASFLGLHRRWHRDGHERATGAHQRG